MQKKSLNYCFHGENATGRRPKLVSFHTFEYSSIMGVLMLPQSPHSFQLSKKKKYSSPSASIANTLPLYSCHLLLTTRQQSRGRSHEDGVDLDALVSCILPIDTVYCIHFMFSILN